MIGLEASLLLLLLLLLCGCVASIADGTQTSGGLAVPSWAHLHLPGTDVRMPLSGLGMCCRGGAKGAAATEAVLQFLAMGGRLIDTAVVYNNHKEIGTALRQTTVPRSEIFLTSKIPGNKLSFDNTWSLLNSSLVDLQVDYIDLMLLHWPGESSITGTNSPPCVSADGSWRLCRLGAWAALEQAQRLGLVRAIGLSNFGQQHIDELAAASAVSPAVNQIEVHPFFPNSELVRFCHDRGIAVTAYASLGGTQLSTQILAQDALRTIADAYAKTVAQVMLRWAIEQGIAVIPGTNNPEHMRSNLQIFDFELSPQHMENLNSISSQQSVHVFKHQPETVR